MAQVLKALNTNVFPQAYHEYFREEGRLIRMLRRGDTLLDVGCGTGRIIPYVGTADYRGFDTNESVIRQIKRDYRTAPHKPEVYNYAATEYAARVAGTSDTTVCLWNTLPIIQTCPGSLDAISSKTLQRYIITLVAKNDRSLSQRTEYYARAAVPFAVDEETHTITSDVWGKSRAYEEQDFLGYEDFLEAKLVETGYITDLAIYGVFDK